MIITNPFSPGAWTREQINNVSRGWWVLLISGVASVVAGGIILATDWTLGDLATFTGAVLLFRGLFTMFSVPLDGSIRIWSIVLGLAEAAVGLSVWVWPGPTLLVIAFFIGWYVLFSGVMAISGAITVRAIVPYWWLLFAFGILETLLAFWLLARPAITLVSAIFAIGLWSLVYGVVQIALSFELKAMPERADEIARRIDSMTPGSKSGAAAMG